VPTLAEFLAAVEQEGDVPWLACRRFARHATAAELGDVFARLVREVDGSRLVSYLSVFSAVRLPRLDSRIFELSQSDERAVRDAAITALALVEARDVRRLGLRLLDEQDIARRSNGIELLSQNHRAQDLARIAAVLPREGPPDVLHEMATKCLVIADRNPQDIRLARWIYECNPCSYCRHGAFGRLAKRNALSRFQLAECAWDSYRETRLAARRLIRKME
jgi:hypothetical protein